MCREMDPAQLCCGKSNFQWSQFNIEAPQLTNQTFWRHEKGIIMLKILFVRDKKRCVLTALVVQNQSMLRTSELLLTNNRNVLIAIRKCYQFAAFSLQTVATFWVRRAVVMRDWESLRWNNGIEL